MYQFYLQLFLLDFELFLPDFDLPLRQYLRSLLHPVLLHPVLELLEEEEEELPLLALLFQ